MARQEILFFVRVVFLGLITSSSSHRGQKWTSEHLTTGDHLNQISSTHQLKSLITSEQEFLQNLRGYLKILKEETKAIEEYLDYEYKEFTEDFTIDNPEDYIANPINAFGVVKRTSYSLDFKLDRLSRSAKISSAIDNLNKAIAVFPSTEEYTTAASSIALIQDFYNLTTDDLADGKIKFNDNEVVEAHYKMRWYDLCQIGIMAGNRGYWVFELADF